MIQDSFQYKLVERQAETAIQTATIDLRSKQLIDKTFPVNVEQGSSIDVEITNFIPYIPDSVVLSDVQLVKAPSNGKL